MRALVTGATGFVGGALVRELVGAGWEVRAAGRSAARWTPPRGAGSCEPVALDLLDRAGLARAAQGCDVLFHVAAKTGVWGARRDFVRANVTGTENALAAALAAGVPRFVFTSSPAVCFDGRDHVRVAELPYPRRHPCAYAATKAAAERAVLAADGRRGAGGVPLATLALRPHLVVGPGDPHLFPRIAERARRGRLFVVGGGANEVSVTDVDNAALAHRLAAEALAPGAPCAGRAYFVAQREPVRLWTWIGDVLERAGLERPSRRVPALAARAAGALCEVLWTALPLAGEPPMTRFVARELASSHSYDTEPLRRDLGYAERHDLARTTERVAADLLARGAT